MIDLTVSRGDRRRLRTVLTGLVVAVVATGCLGPGPERTAQAPGPSTAPSDIAGRLVPVPTPAAVGSRSGVDTAQLIAAAPSCRTHPCRLLARANGFGAPGAVAALLAWDRTGPADHNYELIVTSAAGDLLWRAPEQRLGHANGYERFTLDGPDRLFLPLAVEPRGQMLVVLEWRDGGIDDHGTVSTRRFHGDSVVFAEDRDTDGTAEIITQSGQGLADANTGALIESVYTRTGGDYRLTGCRHREGETFRWTAVAPRGGRCAGP
jgi:hypothetical protein